MRVRDACDASLCVIVPMQKQLLFAPPFHPPIRILPPQPKEQLPCTLLRNDSQSMSGRTGGGSGAKRQRQQVEEDKAAEPAALKIAAQATFNERATSTATRDEFLTRYALNLLSIFTPHLLRPFAVRNFEALMRNDFGSVQLPELQDVQKAMNRQRQRP